MHTLVEWRYTQPANLIPNTFREVKTLYQNAVRKCLSRPANAWCSLWWERFCEMPKSETCLCETKVLASRRDGCEDVRAECLVAFIFRKIKFCKLMLVYDIRRQRGKLTVKARVRTWQPLLATIITMDVESTEAIHTLQLSETVQRYLASSCNKLQQLGTLFLVVWTDGSPEPLDLWRGCWVVVVFSVTLPVVNFDFG